jgi:hypothetical protein
VQDDDVTVLYEGDWAGWDVRLVGVDAEGSRAVIRLAERSKPVRVVFDTVNLETGRRVVRWEARGPCAESLVRGDAVFTCIDGSPDDLDRYAELVGSVGPWHTRGTLMHPVVAASADGTAYLSAPTDSRDGDWIRLRRGDRDQRVGRARASYDPVWAPSGDLVFRVCGPRPGGCNWSLRKLAATGELRTFDVSPRRPPVLSADGKQALVVTGRRSDCVQSVDLETGDVAELVCGALESRVRVSDGGARAVVWSLVEGAVEVRALKAEGVPAQPHRVERTTGVGPVSEEGLLALADVDGAVVVLDLDTGARRDLRPRRGRFSGLAQGRFTSKGLVVLESYPGGFALSALRAAH